MCVGGIKKREDYLKVCRSLNEHENLLMLIQKTELLKVCPSAAGWNTVVVSKFKIRILQALSNDKDERKRTIRK